MDLEARLKRIEDALGISTGVSIKNVEFDDIEIGKIGVYLAKEEDTGAGVFVKLSEEKIIDISSDEITTDSYVNSWKNSYNFYLV